MDEKRIATAQKLLDAAHEFWKACQEEGQHGAVQWLIGTRGELIVFTRGEYRNQLLGNIMDLPREAYLFGEEMSTEEEDNA